VSRDGWLVVHLLGVVLFLGNIVVTALWKLLADRTGAPAVVAYAQRLVTISDVAFTVPGVALIAISGPILAQDLGGIGGPGWLTLGFSLFIAAGVVWAAVLIPIQFAQARMARRFQNADSIPPGYWRLAKLWAVCGGIATLLPLANLYLMVAKPDF
jgi:uncharacterized membrane protein